MVEDALATVKQRSDGPAHDQRPLVMRLGEKFDLFRDHVGGIAILRSINTCPSLIHLPKSAGSA